MINSKVKAQSAFKKLSAATLIIVALIACKHESVNNFTPNNSTPMFTVAFSIVDGKGGTLTAKTEGEATETDKSPITVEQGKLITFTAKASDDYEIDKWSISNGAFEAGTGTNGSGIAKAKITSSVSITVAFKLKKHKVTFSVDSTTPNGTLTAKAEGEAAETDKSPITVEQGKVITFTAKADTGYRVKGWMLDGNPIAEAGTKTEYKHKVTAPATVQVSFEVLSTVEGGALLFLSGDNLTIGVTATTADGSAIVVEGCTETTLESERYTELHAKGTGVILKGNITGLSCRKSLIALDVHGLPALERLNCDINKLTTLDVSDLTSLQELYCGGNQLTELNVQGLTSLQVLGCDSNQLTELNVQGLTSLQTLKCSRNQLTELNVQGLTSLQVLNCENNQIPELNVQGLTALQKLYCRGNKLTELNVQGLTALQGLECHYNQLTSINVQGCTSLRELRCWGNKLNAKAMTELLTALPARETSNGAMAVLYTEYSGEEGNCKDFTQPAELKDAFDGAKSRNWKLKKRNEYDDDVDI